MQERTAQDHRPIIHPLDNPLAGRSEHLLDGPDGPPITMPSTHHLTPIDHRVTTAPGFSRKHPAGEDSFGLWSLSRTVRSSDVPPTGRRLKPLERLTCLKCRSRLALRRHPAESEFQPQPAPGPVTKHDRRSPPLEFVIHLPILLLKSLPQSDNSAAKRGLRYPVFPAFVSECACVCHSHNQVLPRQLWAFALATRPTLGSLPTKTRASRPSIDGAVGINRVGRVYRHRTR